MPNQVIHVKQANLATSLLSRSLHKVIKALHTLFASENLGGEVDL